MTIITISHLVLSDLLFHMTESLVFCGAYSNEMLSLALLNMCTFAHFYMHGNCSAEVCFWYTFIQVHMCKSVSPHLEREREIAWMCKKLASFFLSFSFLIILCFLWGRLNTNHWVMAQGYLDEQFVQLEELQDDVNPNFVEEIVTLFYRDSTRLILNIEQALWVN